MKKLYTLFSLSLLMVAIASCTFTSTDEGPIGPVGPRGSQGQQGPQGEPGPDAFVFEYDLVTFAPSNNFTQFLEFPSDFQPLETDHILVYYLWDYFADTNTDVWRNIPQTLFTDFGTLVYNYDHTQDDVKLFMEANFDLRSLASDYTDDWTVRVVVVPGNYGRAENSEVDFNNYHEVLTYYNLQDTGELSKQRRPQ